MKITIVLDGGLRSCCSSYPTEYVREVVEGWLRGISEVDVIDKKKQNWVPDALARTAEKYFGADIYPLLYVEDTLATIGNLPDADTLVAMATDKADFGVTEEDIMQAARKHGLIKEE